MTDWRRSPLLRAAKYLRNGGLGNLKVGKRAVAISHPDKIFYNAGKFTKLDVINYYLRVAPFLLPHFRDGQSP